MLMDIDIIMIIFMKNVQTKCLEIGGERLQLEVSM